MIIKYGCLHDDERTSCHGQTNLVMESLRASTRIPLASPYSDIVHHLSGHNRHALTQILPQHSLVSIDNAPLHDINWSVIDHASKSAHSYTCIIIIMIIIIQTCVQCVLPYSGKFSYGANFRIFRMLHPIYENKNGENLNVRNSFLSCVTFDL